MGGGDGGYESAIAPKHHHQLQDIDRLIDMSILVDVFMLVSCPGCHGIRCFELCGINEKKRVWQ